LVARKLVIATAGGKRHSDMFGREHPGQHSVVRALDARHVDEARGAADQRAARKSELRYRLPAALGDGARAVANSFSARECISDQRMRLEALKLFEWREIGIAIVQMHDKADRNEIVAEMIDERAAAGAVVERPAESVLHQSALVFVGRNLPKLLETDAE